MMDFIMAALPWVAVGLVIAIVAVISSKKKDKGKSEYNYVSEGMAVGSSIKK